MSDLDKIIEHLSGGDHPSKAVVEERCLNPPIGCGRKLDNLFSFRDLLSKREWTITGLCQQCQDALEDLEEE